VSPSRFAYLVIGFLLLTATTVAAEPTIRIGSLRYGTLSWQLEVIAKHGLDKQEGIRVEPLELAATPAAQLALQAGSVDLIVSDWLWVSRQRAEGGDLTSIPFSSAIGALIVPAASPIRDVAGLAGQRLGLAGSAIDKSWLVLRLYGGTVRFGPVPAPKIGYVFQNPRLLPWRTVRENIALVLPHHGRSAELVDALLAEIGLADAADVYPTRLSGGMARRAALARAFAIAPDLLLMDEPFLSLDAAAADRLRGLLPRLVSTRPATVLFVTHDLTEAVQLADRILVLSSAPGRVTAEMPITLPRLERRDPDTLSGLRAELSSLADHPVARESGNSGGGPSLG
jgi:ABC-type nitrate/sulfonate/bicarbonate transport system ATPase subunit